MPAWKLNGIPGSAAAMRDRSAALSGAAWPGSLTSPVTDIAVPGAVTRSCRTASGRAWPANTASAAATAAVDQGRQRGGREHHPVRDHPAGRQRTAGADHLHSIPYQAGTFKA